ncbi:MAG: universal stress protein [Verrucomicrobia bacterium]|nr:universal stress protein [Verrucomicrobiota bacterium]
MDLRSEKIARFEKEGLIRRLGVADLFAISYGDLGSSIFYALGITAFYALGAAPLSLLLAGVVFICTCLTYAELTAALKGAGGSANFARVAFNDLISFAAGWGLLLDFIVTIAISIFSVSSYLTFLYAGLGQPAIQMGFSIGLIGVLFVMNFFGAHQSTRVSIFLTGFALVTQAIILIIGLFSGIDFAEVFSHMKINIQAAWSPDWADFWKGTAMAMVAYTGIETIAALGNEAKNPVKTLPRAIMIVMGVLVFSYIAIAIVGLGLVTPQALGKEYLNNPIAGIVAHLPFGSHILGPFVGLLAAALLFVAGNAGLLGASRLAFNMGEYYQLPSFFYQVNKRYRTPALSLAIFALFAAAVIIACRGNLHFLADLYNFGAMLAFFSAHVSLIALRIKQPDLERPFRAPINIKIGKNRSIPLTAIIGALATLGVWVLVVVQKPQGRYLGFAWMILGIGMYLIYRKKKKIDPTGQVQIEKIKISQYKPFEPKEVLVPAKLGNHGETVQFACEIAKIHSAKVTVIYLIRVPYSLPLEAPLPYRVVVAESVLQRAEAIANEFGVEIETKVLRCRQYDVSILEYLGLKKFDLLVLSSQKSREKPEAGLDAVTERIMKKAPCRVFIA